MSNAHKFVASKGIEEVKLVLNKIPVGKSFISGRNIAADFYDAKQKKYGMVDGVYKFVWNKDWCCHSYSFSEFLLNTFSLSELKQVVESVEIIESYGGISKSKLFLNSDYRKKSSPQTWGRLKKAIKDYELVEKYKGENNG